MVILQSSTAQNFCDISRLEDHFPSHVVVKLEMLQKSTLTELRFRSSAGSQSTLKLPMVFSNVLSCAINHRIRLLHAMEEWTPLSVVSLSQMRNQFILPTELSSLRLTPEERTFGLHSIDMGRAYMSLQISLPSERLLMLAAVDRTDQWVDMDIVEMVLKQLRGLVASFRYTSVPTTRFRGFPAIANTSSVLFHMFLPFLDAAE